MNKLILLAAILAPAIVQAQSVTGVTVDSSGTTHSMGRFRVTLAGEGSLPYMRMRYSVSPTACASSSVINGSYLPYVDTNQVWMVLSGLAPSTTYNVCPEVSLDNSSWTGGASASFTTAALPTVHPALPIAPATFDTSYPNTSTGTCSAAQYAWSGINTLQNAGGSGYCQFLIPVSDKTCASLSGIVTSAVNAQLNSGSVISIPHGGQVICGPTTTAPSTVWLKWPLPPDLVSFDAVSNVDYTANTITLSGTPFSEGSQWTFAPNSFAVLPGAQDFGDAPGYHTQGGEGQLKAGAHYWAHIVSSAGGNTTYAIYQNAAQASGGSQISFGGIHGSGTIHIAHWPRALNWIIVRPDVPESQFAQAGTRINPAWKSKMGWIGYDNLGSNAVTAAETGNGILDFGAINDGQFLSSNIRFTGIYWSYPHLPFVSNNSDPPAWRSLFSTDISTENLILDRNYIKGEPPPTRYYQLFQWSGSNMALVDSSIGSADQNGDGFTLFRPRNLLAISHSGNTVTLGPGSLGNTHSYGCGSFQLTSNATITFSGTLTGSHRAYLFSPCFNTDGHSDLVLPPGANATVSGTSLIRVAQTDGSKPSGFLSPSSGGAAPTQNAYEWYGVDPIFSTDGVNTTTLMTGVASDKLQGNWAPGGTAEVGLTFHADVNGFIHGVRFLKDAGNTGTHTGSLWTSSGTLLATGTFSGETASGWQTLTFGSRVAITAGTNYQVSFHSTVGWSYSNNFFMNLPLDNGHLHVNAGYVDSNGHGDASDCLPQNVGGIGGGSCGFGAPAVGFTAFMDLSASTSVNAASISGNESVLANVGTTEGCQCIQADYMIGPETWINTVLSGTGNVYNHSEGGGSWNGMGDFEDYYFYRNLFYLPPRWRLADITNASNPFQDHLDFSQRQWLEWKKGARIKMDGNIFLGNYGHVSSFFVEASGRSNQPLHDFSMTNNTFAHGNTAITVNSIVNSNGGGFSGANTSGAPAPFSPLGGGSRMLVQNNLMWDINYVYDYATNKGKTVSTGAFFQTTLDEDVIIRHNTLVGNRGGATNNVSGLIVYADWPQEGIVISDNIFGCDAANCLRSEWDNGTDFVTGNSASTGKARADLLWTSGPGNPSYTFTHNLILGQDGQSGANLRSAWGSLASSNYIPDDTSLSHVGWFAFNATDGSGDFHLKANYCSGCSQKATDGKGVGADIDALEAAQGKVTFTSVSAITGTSVSVNFVAPDAQACPVDVSTSDPAVISSFTRYADSGGVRVRSVAIPSLSVGTTYYFRVDCAVQQPAGVFRTADTSVTPHTVELDWDASTSPNIVGYNVYRGTVTGGPYTKITSSPVNALTYTDTTVTSGTTYFYVVTAVDNTSTESGYSNEINATVP